jgi:excisionase family DNA binding protein
VLSCLVDDPKPDYFTIQAVAKELGVADASVRQAVLRGSLAHVVMYGRKLIPRAALEDYIARTRPGGVRRTGRPPKQHL